MIFGYARVSTNGQQLAAQQASLRAAGCVRIYAEKVGGHRSDRPELLRLLKRVEPGDVVVVTRLDRLARSTRDLLNILDGISRAGASFKSLADTWADTTTAHGRLILTVVGGMAEFERELIRARTGEGRARAIKAGVKFGRPPKLNVFQRREAIARLQAGEMVADIARTFGVSSPTISRLQRTEMVLLVVRDAATATANANRSQGGPKGPAHGAPEKDPASDTSVSDPEKKLNFSGTGESDQS